MSTSPAPLSRSVIITRLRAAGCVFAEDEAQLLLCAARTPAELAAMVDRRAGGLPLEHVLGWAGFCGLRIAVDPRVFVPRRRTEFLVDQAAALARPRPVVVDLCCGSGAVGAALAAALDPVELHAVDIDPAAVRCARRNLPGAHVHEGDLYGPLPATLRGRVDVLVAIAPYVPTGAIRLMPPEARVHEPPVALDGGADGLDVLRRIIAAAHTWLAPGGHLVVETSQRQAPQTAEAVARHELAPRVVRSADLGATVVIGTRAPAPGAQPRRPGGVAGAHELCGPRPRDHHISTGSGEPTVVVSMVDLMAQGVERVRVDGGPLDGQERNAEPDVDELVVTMADRTTHRYVRTGEGGSVTVFRWAGRQ